MENVLILHVTDNNSQGNWYSWLKTELEKMGQRVWLPDLPNSKEPNIKKYNEFIFSNKDWEFNSDSTLIGHSSGAVAIFGLLQNLPESVTVDTCVLVSAFKDNLGYKQLDGLFEEPFDFEKIKKKAKRFIFIHSDNDPYCPFEHAQYLSSRVNGELIIEKGQGHFNLEKGPEYKQFPLLLKVLSAM